MVMFRAVRADEAGMVDSIDMRTTARHGTTVCDLADNVAGAAARARWAELNAQAPFANLCARVLGVRTGEWALRVEASGDELVGRRLAKLGTEWEVLHSIETGDDGHTIDHVVIGPGGVYTLATKHRPRGRAVVDARCVRVNGQHTHHVRNARHEATRAAWLLSEACHFSVAVTPLIVFVGLDDFKIKQMPDAVSVTTLDRLLAWFESRPSISSTATTAAIYQRARWSTTWY